MRTSTRALPQQALVKPASALSIPEPGTTHSAADWSVTWAAQTPVRAREVDADGLGQRQVVGVQQAVGSHQHGILEACHARRLVGHEVAGGLKDREEQRPGATGRDLGSR